MGQYADSILQFLKYALKVLPELRKHNAGIILNKTCPAVNNAEPGLIQDATAVRRLKPSLLCSSFFSLHPGVDTKAILSFIIALYNLSDTLGSFRLNAKFTEELDIIRLYGCLLSAVDPSRSIGCAFSGPDKEKYNPKKEPTQQLCLSDQCRLQLAVLPSYWLAAPKIKKYMQFYVDLHSYMYYPENLRTDYLHTWSDYYLKRYQGISCMEFCAASDSLLGIIAMYASAANPRLTAAELKLVDEACFPWLCGLDSLLQAYIDMKTNENTNHLNYCSAYKNLKDCELRLSFFASKAEEACMKLKNSSFYLSLIKLMLGMYLSGPEAGFGIYRLTSHNILKNGPRKSGFYYKGCKLLRVFRLPACSVIFPIKAV